MVKITEFVDTPESNASQTEWEEESRSVEHCLEKDLGRAMLNDKAFSDVSFVFCRGPNRKPVIISAHKCILATRSNVFREMFLKKTSTLNELVIKVDDDHEAFSDLVQYLYKDDCSLTLGKIFAMQQIAQKYAVKGLKEKCDTFLQKVLSTENVLSTLNQAKLLKAEKLLELCNEVIREHGIHVVMEKTFRISDPNEACPGSKRARFVTNRTALYKSVTRKNKKTKKNKKKKDPKARKEKRKRQQALKKLKRTRWMQILTDAAKDRRTSDLHKVLLYKCLENQHKNSVPMKKQKFQNFVLCNLGFKAKNYHSAAGKLFDILKSVENVVPLSAQRREVRVKQEM